MSTTTPTQLDALALIEDLHNPAIDLPTIARARRMSLTDLLAFIESPPVQAELVALAQLARARADIINITAPSTALATLHDHCANPGPTATDRAGATRAAHTLLHQASAPKPNRLPARPQPSTADAQQPAHRAALPDPTRPAQPRHLKPAEPLNHQASQDTPLVHQPFAAHEPRAAIGDDPTLDPWIQPGPSFRIRAPCRYTGRRTQTRSPPTTPHHEKTPPLLQERRCMRIVTDIAK